MRELREETGITLRQPPVVGPCRLAAGSYYVFQTAVEYIPRPVDSSEVTEARWFTINEMAALPSNVDVSDYLRRNNVKLLPTRNMSYRCYMPTASLLSASSL
jgi:NADH pyrophosphatase NudC (nudix superfamily)